MALKSCNECNSLVSTDAENCPHCGKPDPVNKQRNAQMLRIVYVLLVLIAAASYFRFSIYPEVREYGLLHKMGQR